MASVKELSTKWLVEMSEYIANNPPIFVGGFRRSGILVVPDHCLVEDSLEPGVEQNVLSHEDESEDDVSIGLDPSKN